MKHWKIDQLPWDRFDPSRVDPKIVPLIKTASVVERNSTDYVVYLKNVFKDEPHLAPIFEKWAEEEVQHGDALGKWAMLADPQWDYQKAFEDFRKFYKIDLDVNDSIRGSKTAEFIARAMVETGTSSYYSALADYVDEPVLKDLCRRIAGDEFRHFKLFYDKMNHYLQLQPISKWKRAYIALSRILESQDDEMASAFHVTNEPMGMPYNRKRCMAIYMTHAIPVYRLLHITRVVNMVFKTIGWMPPNTLQNYLSKGIYALIQRKQRVYAEKIAAL